MLLHSSASVHFSVKTSQRARLLALLLGPFGAHRFYVGKTGTALLQLFTLGGLGLWTLYDIVMIITGNFTDKDGEKITEWT